MYKEYLFTFVSRIIQILCSLAIVIIVSRFLGANGVGVYSLLKSFVGILVLAVGLGIAISNVYFLGIKKYSFSILGWNSVVMAFVSGGVGIVVASLLYFLFPELFRGTNVRIFYLAVLSLPLFLLFQSLTSLVLGIQKIFAYNILNIIFAASPVILVLVLVYFFRMIDIVFLAVLIGGFLSVFIIFLYLIKSQLISTPITFGGRVIKETVFWGIKGQIGNVLQFLNYRLGIFVISYFLGPVAVGLYAVALGLSESTRHIPKSISTVVLSKVVNIADEKEAARFAAKSSRIGLFLAVIIAGFIAALSPWIIPIVFGKEFTDSALLVVLLLPGIVFFSITNVLASYIIGRGFPQYNAIASGVSCIFTVILSVIFIPKFGINGTPIALNTSYISSTLITLYFYKKLSHGSIKDAIFLKREDLKILKTLWKRIRS